VELEVIIREVLFVVPSKAVRRTTPRQIELPLGLGWAWACLPWYSLPLHFVRKDLQMHISSWVADANIMCYS